MAVLNQGNVEQLGTPEELYLRPATRFVAGFVGRASAVSGTWRGDGRVVLADDAEETVWEGVAAGELSPGAAVDLVFRPEGLELVPRSTRASLPIRVLERRYAGSQTFYTVRSEAGDRFEVIGSAEGPGDAVANELAVVPRPASAPPRIFARETP